MSNTKTISIRLTSEMISEIDEKCVTDECCRNDFIKNVISDALNSEPESIPEARVTAVSYDDGKTWINVE